MTNLNTIPWVEKYRPTEFDNIVLDPINKRIFKNILDKDYFPNILLYGPPGTGKTTTIVNLINSHQKRYFKKNNQHIIHLNASDERGIDTIRNQIHSFVSSNNLFEKGHKFVILDEVDYMTKNAQQALKILLQSCPPNVKICLICNYISKIDSSLVNEFICMRFNQLPKDKIKNFIRNITDKENIQLSDHDIKTIQQIYNSDIRSIINFVQLNQNIKTGDWKGKIINIETLNKIHEMLIDIKVDSAEIVNFIHDKSIQYNIDKRTIILTYFNMVIRDKPVCLKKSFFYNVSEILHNGELQSMDMLNYFCHRFKTVYD